MTVSVGGEIGEVGGKNSDVHELHAYMSGFNKRLQARNPGMIGLSKISVQTGTAHGGFVNADGSVRKDVAIDLKTLEELSRLSREEIRARRRSAARRIDPRRLRHLMPPPRRRVRDSPRHRLPEHGLRASGNSRPR